jgi:electron transfer flavoprotein alpha/beta subunit
LVTILQIGDQTAQNGKRQFLLAFGNTYRLKIWTLSEEKAEGLAAAAAGKQMFGQLTEE